MSREYPCVYYDNQKCKKFEEPGYTSWCVLGPCSHETPSNADRIRAMSDEELAEHLHEIGWDCNLCSECERLSDNPLLRNERCDEKCAEHCLDWLRQPVKDGDNDG